MAQKDGGYLDLSETNNWNSAKAYSQVMIMQTINDIRVNELIATFGAEDIIQELEMMGSPDAINVCKIKGFKRLLKGLFMLINHSYFACKKADKKTLDKLRKDLKEVQEEMHGIEIRKRDITTKNKVRVSINEYTLEVLLNILIRIKEDMFIPLNNNDLIFSSKDEFDPKEALTKLIEELSTRG